MSMTQTAFGKLPGGEKINLYTLTNESGMTVKITDFGAIVTSLSVPDREGNIGDVVLGFDHLEPYLENAPYFGALVGRYCGRISGAEFTLEEVRYPLVANDGRNHIHGGVEGFNKKVWRAEDFEEGGDSKLTLYYLSRDGEEGYPGNLLVGVTFSIGEGNELVIDYEAETDRATPVNLTHHGYFNLRDCGIGDCLGHRLTLYADRYAPSDENLVATGEIETVKGTPLDFTQPEEIGERIDEVKGGYDHTFVLPSISLGDEPRLVARVDEPVSGRVMEVLTTEPTIHLYTSNFLDGAITGKGGTPYRRHAAFCLEAQHIPGSVHHPQFPTTILEPGDVYRQKTVYRFT